MGAASRRETASTNVLALAGRRGAWWWLAALAALIGAVNLLVLLIQARSLVSGLYLDADNASTFVVPALAGHLPAGAVVNLGNHAWYEPWWFMRATIGLPGYRALWEAAPLCGTWAGSPWSWPACGRRSTGSPPCCARSCCLRAAKRCVPSSTCPRATA